MTTRFKLNKATLAYVEKVSNKALKIAGEHLANKLRQNVEVDTWTHARSITSKLVSSWRVLVGSNQIQAMIEEYGRKPGKRPNFDALVGWAGRKWFHKGRKTAPYNSLDSESKSKVFFLARAIKNNGIKPKLTYTKTFIKEQRSTENVYIKQLKKWLG